MARQYIVTLQGRHSETVPSASKAADLIIGNDRRRHKPIVMGQLMDMRPGDQAYLLNNIHIQVVGDGDEEPETVEGGAT